MIRLKGVVESDVAGAWFGRTVGKSIFCELMLKASASMKSFQLTPRLFICARISSTVRSDLT
ncbi:MAG: hypothetical protein ACREHV_07830, partial [Rhizomicrobium sp.]